MTIQDVMRWIDKDIEHGCWVYARNFKPPKAKYPLANLEGKQKAIHIALWEEVNGPIPQGMQLDHACQLPLENCVNPSHTELVTLAQNLQRYAMRRTHCRKGHEITLENTYISSDGRRRCRICNAKQRRRHYLLNLQ